MPKIYAYILTEDNGSAPCVPDNFLILAICKPVIRAGAKPGDIVVGISGATIADPKQGQGYPKHAVIYAAVVDQVMPWREYATGGFQERMDCIYRCEAVDGGFRRKKDAMVHAESEEKKTESNNQKAKSNKRKPKRKSHKEKDTSSPVLLSRNFRYFGENAIPLSTISPTLEYLGNMGIAQRVFDSAKPDHEEIFKEFEKLL